MATITVTATAEAVASVTVLPRDTTVSAGSSFELRAVTRGVSGDTLVGRPMQWTSSDPGVAQVNPTSGTVTTGRRPGQVELSVVVDRSVRGITRLTVLPPPTAIVAVTPARLTLTAGDTQAVQAQALDSSRNLIEDRSISWTSDDPSVARVAGAGTVVALKAGATTLRANADGKTATVAITVRAPAMTVATPSSGRCQTSGGCQTS